ncbi:unnamed protein product [Gongylonema pulchrum]|uniref:Uncharacterized protein n=1 Tax=Gongylonema pulchrum TaxID=637853 RepID=A0A3P7QK22_9BILA|nr:unnamed protein product [Gongylonema pulchrum]
MKQLGRALFAVTRSKLVVRASLGSGFYFNCTSLLLHWAIAVGTGFYTFWLRSAR